MTVEWQVLLEAGVPLRTGTGATRVDATRVREALRALRDQRLGEAEGDALIAWLRALRSHFPAGFATLAAEDGEALLASLRPADEGRVVKLRRVALANLARLV